MHDYPSQLISHGADADVALEARIDAIKLRIRQSGDMPGASVDRQLELLDEMAQFELGRFLLVNRGLNAEWTHRVVTYIPGAVVAGSLEHDVFEKLPATLATRERFGIFRNELQALLRPACVMASVSCGVMGELLLLDYARHPDVRLIGIESRRRGAGERRRSGLATWPFRTRVVPLRRRVAFGGHG